MPAAARVVEAVVAEGAGVVGVAGARLVGKIFVVARPGIGVFDDGADWCTGGKAVIGAGEDAGQIGFAAGGRLFVFPGGAAGHFGEDKVLVEGHAGWEAV